MTQYILCDKFLFNLMKWKFRLTYNRQKDVYDEMEIKIDL